MPDQFEADGGSIACTRIAGNLAALAFGRLAKTITDANYTLTSSEYSNLILEISGTLTAGRDIVLPLTDGATFIVYNATGQTLTFKGATGTGIAVATTKRAIIYTDGTNFYRVTADT